VKAVRRHGYLLASVARKAARPGDSGHSPRGVEYVVDAFGCREDALRDRARLERLLGEVVRDAGLRVVAEPVWHVFPFPGGVTGLLLLAESHVTVHTYPEHGFAAFNLYCCRPAVEWPWCERLGDALGAREVVVERISRGHGAGGRRGVSRAERGEADAQSTSQGRTELDVKV
jgi:S-adenosylmethionine decarboxylase